MVIDTTNIMVIHYYQWLLMVHTSDLCWLILVANGDYSPGWWLRFLLKDMSGSILWISRFLCGFFMGFLKLRTPKLDDLFWTMTIILDDLGVLSFFESHIISSFQTPRCSLNFRVMWIKPNCLKATDQASLDLLMADASLRITGLHQWVDIIAFVATSFLCRSTSVSSSKESDHCNWYRKHPKN